MCDVRAVVCEISNLLWSRQVQLAKSNHSQVSRFRVRLFLQGSRQRCAMKITQRCQILKSVIRPHTFSFQARVSNIVQSGKASFFFKRLRFRPCIPPVKFPHESSEARKGKRFWVLDLSAFETPTLKPSAATLLGWRFKTDGGSSDVALCA